jgi:hypothetical protein
LRAVLIRLRMHRSIPNAPAATERSR